MWSRAKATSSRLSTIQKNNTGHMSWFSYLMSTHTEPSLESDQAWKSRSVNLITKVLGINTNHQEMVLQPHLPLRSLHKSLHRTPVTPGLRIPQTVLKTQKQHKPGLLRDKPFRPCRDEQVSKHRVMTSPRCLVAASVWNTENHEQTHARRDDCSCLVATSAQVLPKTWFLPNQTQHKQPQIIPKG